MKSIVSAYDERSTLADSGASATPQGYMLAQQRQDHLTMKSSLSGRTTKLANFENVYVPGDKQSVAPTTDGLGVRFSNGTSGCHSHPVPL